MRIVHILGLLFEKTDSILLTTKCTFSAGNRILRFEETGFWMLSVMNNDIKIQWTVVFIHSGIKISVSSIVHLYNSVFDKILTSFLSDRNQTSTHSGRCLTPQSPGPMWGSANVMWEFLMNAVPALPLSWSSKILQKVEIESNSCPQYWFSMDHQTLLSVFLDQILYPTH